MSGIPRSGELFTPKNNNVKIRQLPCGKTILKVTKISQLKFKNQRLRACGYIWFYVQVGTVKGWVQRRKIKIVKAKLTKRPVIKYTKKTNKKTIYKKTK